VIDKIVVFNPIKFINVRRNEVKSKISLPKVKSQMKQSGTAEIYTGEERSQRAAMILKDVKYGIQFHIALTGLQSEHADECEEKHYNIMLRRLKKGQCFRQPCLGCREFSVSRLTLVEDFALHEVSAELSGDTDLGYMLYGLQFKDGGKPTNNDWEHPKFSDEADALYYHPHMINGVIDVERRYADKRTLRICRQAGCGRQAKENPRRLVRAEDQLQNHADTGR
jgi:CRISPR-associated protein Cas5d